MKYVLFIFCYTFLIYCQETQYVEKTVLPNELNENEPLPLPIVENPPVFKGCESKTTQEKRNCLVDGLKTIFNNKFKYPDKSEKENHRFYVNFVVDTNGKIIVDRVIKCKDPLIEEEIYKVFKKIPKAIPATDKNKPVKVKLLIPFDIKWDTQ